ncbi:unnamed protein product, partial [Prorocentrum cordatum]
AKVKHKGKDKDNDLEDGDREKEKDTDRDRDRKRRERSRSRDRGRDRGDVVTIDEIEPPLAAAEPATRRSPSRQQSRHPPPAAAAAPATPPADEDEVHHGITCGRCHVTPIKGDRFKCSVCPEYDLCEDCYEKKGEGFHPPHRFFVQKVVTMPPPLSEEPQPAPLPDAPALSSSVTALPAAMFAGGQEHVGIGLEMARIAAALQRQQSSPSEPPPAAWPAPGFLTGQPPPREPPPREAPPKEATPPPAPAADPIPSASEMAPWLDARVPCSLCHRASPSGEAHGVVCYRRRKGGAEGGCSQGVCWECMESRPRSELGMVRTTRDELESLGKQGWWMHERCMDPADLRAYFGSEKDVALARAAADQADAAQLHGGASQAAGSSAAPAVVDPIEAVRTRLRGMSVKELKAYLELHRVDFSGLVEKSELLARALELASKATSSRQSWRPRSPLHQARQAGARWGDLPTMPARRKSCRLRRWHLLAVHEEGAQRLFWTGRPSPQEQGRKGAQVDGEG